jgi:hypothetical protein
LKVRSVILEGSVDRKVRNYYLDRLIRLRLDSEMVDVVLRKVG